MSRSIFFAFGTITILVAVGVSLATDTPTRTSSFFGTIALDGGTLPDGTAVTAWIDGTELESTSVFPSSEGPAFHSWQFDEQTRGYQFR